FRWDVTERRYLADLVKVLNGRGGRDFLGDGHSGAPRVDRHALADPKNGKKSGPRFKKNTLPQVLFHLNKKGVTLPHVPCEDVRCEHQGAIRQCAIMSRVNLRPAQKPARRGMGPCPTRHCPTNPGFSAPMPGIPRPRLRTRSTAPI